MICLLPASSSASNFWLLPLFFCCFFCPETAVLKRNVSSVNAFISFLIFVTSWLCCCSTRSNLFSISVARSLPSLALHPLSLVNYQSQQLIPSLYFYYSLIGFLSESELHFLLFLCSLSPFATCNSSSFEASLPFSSSSWSRSSSCICNRLWSLVEVLYFH